MHQLVLIVSKVLCRRRSGREQQRRAAASHGLACSLRDEQQSPPSPLSISPLSISAPLLYPPAGRPGPCGSRWAEMKGTEVVGEEVEAEVSERRRADRQHWGSGFGAVSKSAPPPSLLRGTTGSASRPAAPCLPSPPSPRATSAWRRCLPRRQSRRSGACRCPGRRRPAQQAQQAQRGRSAVSGAVWHVVGPAPAGTDQALHCGAAPSPSTPTHLGVVLAPPRPQLLLGLVLHLAIHLSVCGRGVIGQEGGSGRDEAGSGARADLQAASSSERQQHQAAPPSSSTHPPPRAAPA